MEPARIRAALALLDAKTEKIFINDVIRLAEHPEESIRIKGLAAAARVGGPAGFEVIVPAGSAARLVLNFARDR